MKSDGTAHDANLPTVALGGVQLLGLISIIRRFVRPPFRPSPFRPSPWLAQVELMPWEPSFEIRHRRVVPSGALLEHLSMEAGFEPLYYRALVEAGLAQNPWLFKA